MIVNSGRYIAPNNSYTINVPIDWHLTDKMDSLEIVSPQEKTTVIITIYRKTAEIAETDARKHLQRFLSSQDKKGSVIPVLDRASRASADFTDRSGRKWRAVFVSNPEILVLGTCISASTARNEIGVAYEVLQSIRLRTRAGGPVEGSR